MKARRFSSPRLSPPQSQKLSSFSMFLWVFISQIRMNPHTHAKIFATWELESMTIMTGSRGTGRQAGRHGVWAEAEHLNPTHRHEAESKRKRNRDRERQKELIENGMGFWNFNSIPDANKAVFPNPSKIPMNYVPSIQIWGSMGAILIQTTTDL